MLENGYVKFALPPKSCNVCPPDVKKITVHIIHSIKGLDGKVSKDNYPDFSEYNLTIVFVGRGDNNIEYICSWHLDYESKAKKNNADDLKIYHPLFHLTYGGTTMRNTYECLECAGYRDIKENAYVKGKISMDKVNDMLKMVIKDNDQVKTSFIPLLLLAPRIPFYPMDIFLGIDFIISNFLKKEKYNELQANDDYNFIIRKSQEKLLKPYFTVIASNWNKGKVAYPALKPQMFNQTIIP